VIEDACHALGARYNGRPVGSLSHLTVFSFHPVKHITTGEGGMVTTDNPEFAKRLRMFRNHGLDADARQREVEGRWSSDMVMLGYNYRLSDIACALGLSQLRRLDANLARRRQIAQRYTEAFRAMPGVIPPVVRPEVAHAWHLYPIRLDLGRLRVDRDEIVRVLRAERISATVHYIPVHWHPYYRQTFGYQPGACLVAETAYKQLVSLPMFHGMTDQDAEDVITAIRKVLASYGA